MPVNIVDKDKDGAGWVLPYIKKKKNVGINTCRLIRKLKIKQLNQSLIFNHT